jgi:hypothetical protein
MLLLFGGCSKFSEEPQPDSLLNAHLPDVQVPVSDSGTGIIDISSANHLSGNYSVKFGKPRHGKITADIQNGIFSYVADTNFLGRDMATYFITRTVLGTESHGEGTIYFQANAAACFIKANQDIYTFDHSGPWYLKVLDNDNTCGDSAGLSITDISRATEPNHTFSVVGNSIVYTYPLGTPGWTGSDSAQYTITRNGLSSTAWVKVTRTQSCAERFNLQDDSLSWEGNPLQILIKASVWDLFRNDSACPGDLNLSTLRINPAYFHGGRIRLDGDSLSISPNPIGPDSGDGGYFTYTLSAHGINRSANVYVHKR